MANLKSSKKDVRRIQRHRASNIPQKTRLRNLAKTIHVLATGGETEGAKEALRMYYVYLDRAARKRLIHPKRAARYKSRSSILINNLSKTKTPT